jgi:hypothetical protein
MNIHKEELIRDITELFRKNKQVQEYYQLKFNPVDKEILEKYKTIVENEFFPPRGSGNMIQVMDSGAI